jgi:hypothetical protein
MKRLFLLLGVLVIAWAVMLPKGSTDRAHLEKTSPTSGPNLPSASSPSQTAASISPGRVSSKRPRLSEAERQEGKQAQDIQAIYTGYKREDEAFRKARQEKDEEEGINADIREREALLRELSGSLQKGMSGEEVVRLLGQPRNVYLPIIEVQGKRNPRITVTDLPSIRGKVVRMTYSPHPTRASWGGLDSFQILLLEFDTAGQLEKWYWETPHLG